MAAPNLKSRKVLRFRTQIDPMIGFAKNAFDKRNLKEGMKDWEFELLPIGVYVKAKFFVQGKEPRIEEHIVPFANVQSVMLAPEEEGAPKEVSKEEG